MKRLEEIGRLYIGLCGAIRGGMLLQILATFAALSAVWVGRAEVGAAQARVAEVEALVGFVSGGSDDCDADGPRDAAGCLARAWQYDTAVLLAADTQYQRQHLDRASTVAVVGSIFALVIESKEAKRTAQIAGSFSFRVNLLRQDMHVLQSAAARGAQLVDLKEHEVRAYVRYLDFESWFCKDGGGASDWTKLAKLAVVALRVGDGADGFISDLIGAPKVEPQLDWAAGQLVQTEGTSAGWASVQEKFGCGQVPAAGREALAGEGEAPLSTARQAMLLSVFPTAEQGSAGPREAAMLAAALEASGAESLRALRAELELRHVELSKLEKTQQVSIPGVGVSIPAREAWLFVPVGLVLTVWLFRQRRRALWCLEVIADDTEIWDTAIDAATYPLVDSPRQTYWFWQVHYDVLGLTGVSIVGLAVWALGEEGPVFALLLGLGLYACVLVLVLRDWSRVRRQGDRVHRPRWDSTKSRAKSASSDK